MIGWIRMIGFRKKSFPLSFRPSRDKVEASGGISRDPSTPLRFTRGDITEPCHSDRSDERSEERNGGISLNKIFLDRMNRILQDKIKINQKILFYPVYPVQNFFSGQTGRR